MKKLLSKLKIEILHIISICKSFNAKEIILLLTGIGIIYYITARAISAISNEIYLARLRRRIGFDPYEDEENEEEE